MLDIFLENNMFLNIVKNQIRINMSDKKNVFIEFEDGSLIIDCPAEYLSEIENFIVYDERIKKYRAEAYRYPEIMLHLFRSNIPFRDNAKKFSPVKLLIHSSMSPRDYQSEALERWIDAEGRGIVVLPTGSGKSYFACMAMEHIKRPTLILVPTIDLMEQWASLITKTFQVKVGMLGGGAKEIEKITVSTYESAVLHMEFIGNQFGMIIFDECHHLPAPRTKLAASMCCAPYRLGLTATPEREDEGEGEEILNRIIGPEIFRVHIDELEGNVLADYEIRQIMVELDEDERKAYQLNRKKYTDFLRRHRINFKRKDDWSRFIIMCSRASGGKDAFQAYLNQKRIARRSRAKFKKIWQLIASHHRDRIIIFSADNDTAYHIGKLFLLPVITHRTKTQERKFFLDNFRNGEYPILVTSKVLNEGVDVPQANLGIIVSGSGSSREHVQRLGRILRPKSGVKAILYEIVSSKTSEMKISRKRKEHRAYKRPSSLSKKRRYS